MHLQYTEIKKKKLLLAAYLEMCVQFLRNTSWIYFHVIYSAVFSGKKNNELKIQSTVKIGTKKDIYGVYFRLHIKFTEVK